MASVSQAFFPGPAEELIESRSGVTYSSDGHRQYVRIYRVRTSNKYYGADSICKCRGLPKMWAPYVTEDNGESDLLAVLTNVTAAREYKDDWQCWLVTCTYSTSDVPPGGIPTYTDSGSVIGGSQNNPVMERPYVRWDSEIVTRALQKDLDGKAFVNSSGQPFTPAPMFETARPVLVVVRNESTFSRVIATNYNFSVNSDKFLGAEPGTVRLSPLQAEQMQRGSLTYWRVTYRFVFGAQKMPTRNNPVIGSTNGTGTNQTFDPPFTAEDPLESWQPEILDAGTMKLQKVWALPFAGTPVHITKNGQPVTQPVLLDGTGGELFRTKDDGTTRDDENGTFKPVFLPFRIYRARPFNILLDGSILP